MKRFLATAVALLLSLAAHPARAEGRFHVAFFSIGLPTEFWDAATVAARAAAADLDIELEVFDAKGDHLRLAELAIEVSKRKENRPDYALVDDEKAQGGRMLDALLGAGIPVMGFVNVVTGADRERLGAPREKYPHYVGTIRPDYIDMGERLAAQLGARAMQQFEGPVEWLAISGVKRTFGAARRDQGLQRYFAEAGPHFRLNQLVHSNWKRDKAHAQLAGLLRRWPHTRVIWAANDPMALGAMDAVLDAAKVPGKDVLLGGVNWSPEVARLVRDGTMVATAGGHFLFAAWALVLLRDLRDGRDFASESTELVVKTGLIDQGNAAAYLAHFGDGAWDRLDFTRFSKSLNPSLTTYDFTLARLLEQPVCVTSPCPAAPPPTRP